MSTEAQERADGLAQGDEEAIMQALRNYPAGYQAKDARTFMSLWDPEFGEQLTLFSVERPNPTCGATALKEYYEFLSANYTVLGGDVTDVKIRVEGSLAYVACTILWSWATKAGGKVTIPARTTILMRKRGTQWLFHHIHESITWKEPS